MRIRALYTGSFDPLTNGHYNIIERAARIYDELTVGIIASVSKKSMFSIEERKTMIEETLADFSNVAVESFSGLLADYVNEKGYNVIVRGLRSSVDFDYELQMSQINDTLFTGDTETVFMMTAPEYSFISSSLVKEVFSLGGTIETLVPAVILDNMNRLGVGNLRER